MTERHGELSTADIADQRPTADPRPTHAPPPDDRDSDVDLTELARADAASPEGAHEAGRHAGPPPAPVPPSAPLTPSGPPAPSSAPPDAGPRNGPLLASGDTERYRARWTDLQTGFVDSPRQAVEQADALVADLMQHLARTFADERSGLEQQWDRGSDVPTDDLRTAFQRYRSFFERLLAT